MNKAELITKYTKQLQETQRGVDAYQRLIDAEASTSTTTVDAFWGSSRSTIWYGFKARSEAKVLQLQEILADLLQLPEPVQSAVTIREEQMNQEFMKYHVLGAPLDMVFHKFSNARDEFAHDHNFAFTSTILKGGYKERIYNLGYTGELISTIDVVRKPGDTFRVETSTVHQILELLDGECWTLIQPEAWEKQPGFYDFRSDGLVWYRQWNGDWKPYKPH